jgi:predicted alpha-1,2-mannosidase
VQIDISPRRFAYHGGMHTALRTALALIVIAEAASCSGGREMPPVVDAGPDPVPDAGTPDVIKPQVPVSPLFIGSGGFAYAFGSAFPGAAAPQGLAKVGPDTSGPWGTIRFLHFSGYWYGDDTIQGFSHLHLEGTGATDYGILSVMPSDGFDASRTTRDGYGSKFAKASESAVPGLYAVTLDRGNIRAEITATPHGAHHRYTFPKGATAAHVIVDLGHHLDSGTVDGIDFTLDPAAQKVTGKLHSMGGMSKGFGGYDLFFAARARSPWTASQVWSAGVAPAPGTTAKGTDAGFDLAFDPATTGPIELQFGISLVSIDEASKNLAAELPAWDFAGTAKTTAAAWDALTSRVLVTGGTAAQRDQMSAALYHAFLMPTVMSDVDGSYKGMDGQLHTATDFRYVTDMSLWDTYRTLHPLYALIAPVEALDSVKSLHEKAKQGGFFPKWPIATGEAGTMIGASSEIVVADAWRKGIKGFDAEGAYQVLRAAAMDPVAPAGGRGGREQIEDYMKLGYVPATVGGSVSRSTEYACDDLALADLAAGLGHADDAAALRKRATGYHALFDATTGFLWARNADGSFNSDSHDDPTAFLEQFTEANAWQSLWLVERDAEGIATLLGGHEKAVAKLSQMFDLTKAEWDELDTTDPLKSAGQRPYYWAGNEGDMHVAYLFADFGRPDLTQRWVAWARENLFGPGAEGLPGNDDGGTMSAWYIWSSLGFYPIAGSDRYVIGTPLFPHAEIAVPGGKFTVDADDAGPGHVYVQSAELDGKPLTKAEIHHGDLKSGGSLHFKMGKSPSAWGREG